MTTKGIVLAGGTGSRLWPMTLAVSKQLLPIYDKPLIYYPISTLMLSGIREILIITSPQDNSIYQNLLGNGDKFGVTFSYAIQEKPEGLAQAYIIAEDFLRKSSSLMILGDNLFYGAGVPKLVENCFSKDGAHVFLYHVQDPTQYGVLELDTNQNPVSIQEKPVQPKSSFAVTGLYYFDSNASNYAKEVTPSKRGELEITSIINRYLESKTLSYTKFSRGAAWLDTGSPQSLHDASSFVRVIEERTGNKVACLEEISWRNGWLKDSELLERAEAFKNNSYGKYLFKLLDEKEY